jgi:colanic acid biosynthesis glycosyl transferase WcaI
MKPAVVSSDGEWRLTHMKILISACHFTPDPIGVGKFNGEMAEWLALQGHDVRAIVGAPFYPQWKIAEGYSGTRYKRETIRGVDVLRCPVYVPRKQGGLARLLQYASLALTSTPPLLAWALRWRPDVIWTVMPPLAGMPSALLAARLCGAPSWLHVQDFEVDAAFELGLLNSNGLRKFFLGLERRLMSAFRIVSTITLRMQDQLDHKKITAEKVLFPNWVDVDSIYPLPDAHGLRDELGIPRQAFVGLYSGNLGEKQGVDDLVALALLLSNTPDFRMVICGDGVGRVRLAALAGDLGNIIFLPLQPMEKFNLLLNMADVHLLPQKPEIADLMMPSKLPGMLASGRPVVTGALPGTQLAQEVDGCGLVVPPGDPAAMAQAVRTLMQDIDRSKALGAKAAARARERWAKEAILARFAARLAVLVDSRGRS